MLKRITAVLALVALGTFAAQAQEVELAEPAGAAAALPEGWTQLDIETLTSAHLALRDRAVAARNDFVTQLVSRLMSSIDEVGAAGSVGVCTEMAPRIAGELQTTHGVRIGRTSVRLRNPSNAAPDWALPAIAENAQDVRLYEGPGGQLAMLSPIRQVEFCASCHGDVESLAPGVHEALLTAYPDDQATGFHTGDLRGWFWIEVPIGTGGMGSPRAR